MEPVGCDLSAEPEPHQNSATTPVQYLGHGEAQLGQLHVSNQWDGDAVGQHQVAVDNVLDDAVGEAAAIGMGEGWGGGGRGGRTAERGRGGGKQNGIMNYLAAGALGS